ncbi:MAG: hypothetical protein NVS2B17_29080 [Candidatus Velthaea sp.]
MLDFNEFKPTIANNTYRSIIINNGPIWLVALYSDEGDVMVSSVDRATVTVQEAGKILGIGRNAAYDAVSTGRIPSIRISPRRIVVPRAALEKMLAVN